MASQDNQELPPPGVAEEALQPIAQNQPEQRAFLVDDALSDWTRQLAAQIPRPSMQFDTRSERLQAASRLWWMVTPDSWVRLDVFTPDVATIIEGCIVYIVAPGLEPQEVVVRGNDHQTVADALKAYVQGLPRGYHLATEAEVEALKQSRRDRLDPRRFLELGRMLREGRGILF